ncbi:MULTISPECIES: arylamine N-acetyltransferase family protein [Streptomyces]|uniref:arylamine N-acetyltransferase family protein n=1 Tax=Streptomyces TaxID=1883 RepID=UPI001E5C3F5F|nr:MULTISPECIES: arylamine N-acetyltransferase [Streptomyces]UFQ13825.1 arylamine N-acetyltransferase [Streptomyces huasconensis]WCL83423.1 arylamine N-acetyltransferase [Streptomyces sp. JCM 35825]
MNTEQTDAYLRRIGAARPAAPTDQALRELHLAHLRAIPFENLSVHLGAEIELTAEALVAKVVDARRGGFCYELNGAFAALLTSLGFDVTLMQARVYDDTGRPGIPYDHLALRVGTRDGGDWLADIGFGAHSHLPLAFGERGEQADPGGTFRLVAAAAGDLEVVMDGRRQYLIDPRPRELADFRAGAWYHRTCPDSHFTRSLVCSIVTDDGRVTLSGRTLTTTVDGERHITELATETEVLAAYERHFGIRLEREPSVGSVRTTG